MTKEKQKISKHIAYNKKRKPILRVEASTADSQEDIAEMEQMKDQLVAHSGNAKQGVIDMYRFAKENGFFDKKTCNARAHECNDKYRK